jgi:hypothetical protein
MPNVTYNKFSAGFISEYDINGLVAPDSVCKDISNFEINAPNYALKESTGSALVYAIPPFFGSRIVAHKNWKVTSPSEKELTILITASGNLLKYSENFNNPVWTFTAGGSTLVPEAGNTAGIIDECLVYDAQVQMYGGYSCGQSFTGDGRKITGCRFYLTGGGAGYSGNCRARLYSHKGVYGTSSLPDAILASSNTVLLTDIGSGWADFVFPTPYTSVNGTHYVIEYEHNGGDFSHITYFNWKTIKPAPVTGNVNIPAAQPDGAAAFSISGVPPDPLPSPDGTHNGSQLTDISNTTKIEQLFDGVTGTQYVFSMYFRKINTKIIRITIVDNVGSTSATSTDSTDFWTRLSVTHNCAGTSGFLVRIDFPDATGVEDCDIYGAQIEGSATAGDYSHTLNYNYPYQILQRPYYNGTAWVDEWMNLTEMRSGVITASADETFTITGLDGASGYYNNWYVWVNTLAIPTGYITGYSAGGVFAFVGKKIADDGAFVIVSRFPFFAETPYFQVGAIDENNITFIEVGDDLKISFGETHRPLTIRYIDSTILDTVSGQSRLEAIADNHVGSSWFPSPATPTTLFDKLNGTAGQGAYIRADMATDYYECDMSTTAETPTIARYEYGSVGYLSSTRVGTVDILFPDMGTSLNTGDIIGIYGGDLTATLQVTGTSGSGSFKKVDTVDVISRGWSGFVLDGQYGCFDLVVPGKYYNLIVVVTALNTDYATSEMHVDLYCGATLIHTGNTHVSPITKSDFVEYLTPTQVAQITAISGGWSILKLRFYSTVSDRFYWTQVFISGFTGSGAGALYRNEFILAYSCHQGVQTPIWNNPQLDAVSLAESEGIGFGISVITLSAGTSGSLTAGEYKIYVVGLIDGNQRIPIWTDSIIVTANGSISVAIPVTAAGFDWRLIALEVYLGDGIDTPGDTSAYHLYATVLMENIIGGVLTTSLTDNCWTITVNVTELDTLQSTLLYNLVGCLDIIETRARYNVGYYLLGRLFIAQTEEPGNIIRYSNIRGIVGEIDKFAYSDMGYGFFTSDSSDNQTIMNLGRTIENDLLIIKENEVSLFEVQSGSSSAKRLRQMFNGIGSSNVRGLVISDYGNFWYDDNDIYWYQGGYSVPAKISKDKIRHYWRTVLASYIATSFAIFNRQVNEYWIFIYNGTAWVVLRFSPEFGNWNIWTPGYTPVWLSEKIDGTITMSRALMINQFGGTPTVAPYIVTHKRKISEDGISPKQIDETYMTDYSSSNSITMAVTIDNETTPRTGNSPVYLSTKTSQRRSIRAGSSVNFATIRISAPTNGSTQIKEFGLVVQNRKDRTSGRK